MRSLISEDFPSYSDCNIFVGYCCFWHFFLYLSSFVSEGIINLASQCFSIDSCSLAVWSVPKH